MERTNTKPPKEILDVVDFAKRAGLVLLPSLDQWWKEETEKFKEPKIPCGDWCEPDCGCKGMG